MHPSEQIREPIHNSRYKPLAERMRPLSISEYVGQSHLVDYNAPIGRMLQTGHLTSMIFWGPPGVGKTTLAELLSSKVNAPFFKLSATASGVANVREVLAEAEKVGNGLFASVQRPILFIDEIHRFSKGQQDSLLAAVERGVVTLIGATTENPSFEVIRPLLSRCQVFVLRSLSPTELKTLLDRAINKDPILIARKTRVESDVKLIAYSGGDARKLLNLLEMIEISSQETPLVVSDSLVEEIVLTQPAAFDKGGEMHYDIASAMIKSIRGSDPDAAIYWMARLIEGGEPPRFIARRLVISAAEDIGLANPQALVVANAAAQAVDFIGWPEGRIPLSEAVIYLACSPKSNSAYLAVNEALAYSKEKGNLSVPLHLRNAVTDLMGELRYGKGYRYPHDFPKHFVEQQYLPDEAQGKHFYHPQEIGAPERALVEYLRYIGRYPAKTTKSSDEE